MKLVTELQMEALLCVHVYATFRQTESHLLSLSRVSVFVHMAGGREPLWECVAKDSQETVPTDLCDSAHKPVNLVEDCSSRPCPA